MIKIQPKINGRSVVYLDIRNNLEQLESAHLENWAVFVIADDITNPILEDFADVCIKKGVLYMCATGKACGEIDDLFDMNIVMRKINGTPMPSWFTSDSDTLMTTWDYDFDEGFWFCMVVANNETRIIDKVLVANFTDQDYLNRIQQLTDLVYDGWLPPV